MANTIKKSKPELHLVLLEPEIPPNTGNIGRTCVGLGATLHLVGKLGFSLDSKLLKRAGLDYWPKLKFHVHAEWAAFEKMLPPDADVNFFSTHGTQSLWSKTFRTPCYLIFGSESKGFPKDFYQRYKDRLIRIPVGKDIRSLNLSVAAGVAAFEVARQMQ
jgi:tRNA (cytidine/uridine-2'-O-)-methyltransferase